MTTPPTPPTPPVAPLTPSARQGNATFAITIALLLVRLALGWTFIYHGLQLTFGLFGGPGIKGFAGSLNHLPAFLPPAAWAYLAAYGQLIGGITVLLGLVARLGSILILINMFVAIATVHAPHGFSLAHGGYEYNVNLIAEALLILLAGPGLISLDAFLFPRNLWARGPQPLDQPATRT